MDAGPRIVERLVYRQDRIGFLGDKYQHILAVPADGGTPRQLTEGDFNYGVPTWEPDGGSLLFSGLIIEDADYRWQESEIYRLDAASGELSQVTTRKGPDARPVASPDGRMIAYVGARHDDLRLHRVRRVRDERGRVEPARADGGKWTAAPGRYTGLSDGRGLYFDVTADG